MILAHYLLKVDGKRDADYVGAKFAEVYQSYIFAKEPGTADIVGIDGIHRILGYVPVTSSPAPGLYVGVGLTTATAFGDQCGVKGRFILIALGLALGLLLAWLGGLYFISHPIESLVRASRHWSRGDFATRADLGRGESEIIQLGRTFDDMASELQLRQQDNAILLATLESRVEKRTQVLQRAQAELQEANVSLETQARELAAANRELRSEMEHRERAEETLRHLQKTKPSASPPAVSRTISTTCCRSSWAASMPRIGDFNAARASPQRAAGSRFNQRSAAPSAPRS